MKEDNNLGHNFLRSTTEAFCVLNEKGEFTYVSPSAALIFHCPEHKLQKKSLFTLIHADDVLEAKKALTSAVAGKPVSFETRFSCGERAYAWVAWNAFYADKNIYAIAHDVTKVHEDRETLSTAQNRLRLLHQATSDPTQTLREKIERVLTLGNKQLGMETAMVSQLKNKTYVVMAIVSGLSNIRIGRHLTENQTFDSVTIQVENLVGIHNVTDSVYDELPAHAILKTESYIAIPLYIDREIFGVLSFSSGSPRAKPFDVTDNDFVRLIGQWISSSFALMFANERIAYTAAIVSSSEDAIIGQTPDGHITTWNKGAEKLFQYTDKEVLGKHFSIIVPTDAEREIETILDKLLRGERVEHYDTVRKKKDGNLIDVSVTVSPIVNEEEKIIGASSVLRDITREKQIDRAKTEFVSLASHQLRTPLSAINWYAELLMDGTAGKMTAKQREFVDEIFQGNLRMVKLVNELLNVSRIDFGNFIIEPVDVDVIDIAYSIVKELTPSIQKKRLLIEERFSHEKFIYKADPNILRIIFQNLISNSVKYTPDKGKIVVSIEDLHEKKKLLIRVSDTGYGIPANQQNQIFTKLFRADNVKEMDTAGTGLGLYILKSVVEESGGTISFASKENEGTTFTVLLPLSGMKRKEGGKELSRIVP